MAMEFDPDSWPACWILGMLARDGNAREFYHSGLWLRKRKEIIRDQHNRCWACLQKSPPVLTRGRDPSEPMRPGEVALTVHHRLELRRRPDLALSDLQPDGSPNLVALCPSCHWEMHHARRPEITPERW